MVPISPDENAIVVPAAPAPVTSRETAKMKEADLGATSNFTIPLVFDPPCASTSVFTRRFTSPPPPYPPPDAALTREADEKLQRRDQQEKQSQQVCCAFLNSAHFVALLVDTCSHPNADR